ncbi:hypothetical protein QQ045_032381 [Rhodiola kirilowii]
MAMFLALKMRHLPRIQSDHCPLLIQFYNNEKRDSMFHYLKVWEEHPSFKDVIRDSWNRCLHLRITLKSWNCEVFNNVNRKIKDTQLRISYLEGCLQTQWDVGVAKELDDLVQKHELFSGQELAILRAKARMNWLKDGDFNTTFFHVALKVRHSRNKVKLVQEDGEVIEGEDVANLVVEYFKELFSQHTPPCQMASFGKFTPCISDNENDTLTAIPNEVWRVISER